MKQLVFCLLLISGVSSLNAQQKTDSVYLHVSIQHKGKPVACNVRLHDTHGNYLRPDSTSAWKDFTGHVFEEFACEGGFNMKIPYGEYYYEVDRGPAYKLLTGVFIAKGKNFTQRWKLQELVDVSKRKWWAGETHIHRKPADVELLMKASDLHVGEVINSWNDNFPTTLGNTVSKPILFDGNRYYEITATEDERGGGALLFFNLSTPFNFTNQQTEYPPLVQSIGRVLETNKNAWVDIEKPFWPDVPILLATGQINSIGIANNHMLKKGVFDTEAWGKKRDMLQYPSPLGNAFWTQDLYYHILNAGFHIPPSAGSASGVLWNPVGYNRFYAYVEDNLTYDNWWSAVRNGKTFVSNGPLLFCRANKQLPGHVFKVEGDKPLKIEIDAELFSRDSVTTIEIIKNGKVMATIDPSTLKKNRFVASVNFDQAGWFLVRAISTANNNFRFASTAPFYVENSIGKKMISRSACEFFLSWLKDRGDAIKIGNMEQQQEVNASVEKARKFWEGHLAQANAQ